MSNFPQHTHSRHAHVYATKTFQMITSTTPQPIHRNQRRSSSRCCTVIVSSATRPYTLFSSLLEHILHQPRYAWTNNNPIHFDWNATHLMRAYRSQYITSLIYGSQFCWRTKQSAYRKQQRFVTNMAFATRNDGEKRLSFQTLVTHVLLQNAEHCWGNVFPMDWWCGWVWGRINPLGTLTIKTKWYISTSLHLQRFISLW